MANEAFLWIHLPVQPGNEAQQSARAAYCTSKTHWDHRHNNFVIYDRSGNDSCNGRDALVYLPTQHLDSAHLACIKSCSPTCRVNLACLLLAEAARCFQLHMEQRPFIMNLNSWNYISRVVNLRMSFLCMPTNHPPHSARSKSILGIWSVKTGGCCCLRFSFWSRDLWVSVCHRLFNKSWLSRD